MTNQEQWDEAWKKRVTSERTAVIIGPSEWAKDHLRRLNLSSFDDIPEFYKPWAAMLMALDEEARDRPMSEEWNDVWFAPWGYKEYSKSHGFFWLLLNDDILDGLLRGEQTCVSES